MVLNEDKTIISRVETTEMRYSTKLRSKEIEIEEVCNDSQDDN